MIRPNSFKYNGEYFENLIPGYQTINSEGREAIGFEQQTASAESIDGLTYKGKRLTERKIEISFVIEAESSTAVRSKISQLLGYLQQEKAQLIFEDEADRYYVGTVNETPEIKISQYAASGTYDFLCTDPYKYAVIEDVVQPAIVDGLAVFAVNYGGTALSHPTFEATMNSGSGFLGFQDTNDNQVQIGDYDEEDGYARQIDVDRMRSPQNNAWSAWARNTAVVAYGTQTGTMNTSGTSVKPSSYGSGSSYHGPSMVFDTSAHDIISGKFTANYKFMNANSTAGKAQTGQMSFVLMGGSASAKERIAEIQLQIKSGGHTGAATLYVGANTKARKTLSFSSNKSNAYTSGKITIEKFADRIVLGVGGKVYSFVDTALADMSIAFCGLYIAKFGTKAEPGTIGISAASLVQHNVDEWVDIEDKLKAGELVAVDTGSAAITVDGINEDKLGAIGNDWERFGLVPGENTLIARTSSWSATLPDFQMRYRKVWL